MNIKPIVRYILLSEDFVLDPFDRHQITVVNLRASYRVIDDDYPALIEQICCVLAVTDARGRGIMRVRCIDEESEQIVFSSGIHDVVLTEDPLELTIIPFRIRDCRFPKPGVYSFQVLWNGDVLESCPLRMR